MSRILPAKGFGGTSYIEHGGVGEAGAMLILLPSGFVSGNTILEYERVLGHVLSVATLLGVLP